MKRRTILSLMAACSLAISPGIAAAASDGAHIVQGPVNLWDGRTEAAIIHPDDATSALAAGMLAHDLKALTGQDAKVSTHLEDCIRICVTIGTWNDPMVARLAPKAGVLKDQWERYERRTLTTGGRTILLIAGSDRRGMVWGVVDLTREMGVSAWEWWADVAPRHADRIDVKGGDILSDAPSVHYRGLFLNDEDWGLEPWSAKTYDPAGGNIGPKTYARIYELMWRLKANTIWPAMHDVTTPFYKDLNNPKLANDYAIVVGTSHAEPMLRNNTSEWDAKTMGRFNFLTNAGRMTAYWRTRIDESKPFDSLYTMGLRGTGDGPMEGADTPEARRDVLQKVIGVQRDILSQTLNKPAARIPQAFTVYKEVEDAYNAGLKLPDDITLVWCDDNYGYLTRLGSAEEQKRSGGSGIYYHISYWGRPHDYLWLATTHPGLIREEMGRAYDENARKEWILNVGDIKPGEYLTQYFMDLAFDHKLFDAAPRAHLQAFMAQQFGAADAPEIAGIMMRYYDLAFERKPEFMGWDQTEPITPTHTSAYVRADGEEAQARLLAYADLVRRAEAVAKTLPADRQAAFFELVLYPVRGAANLNTRILDLDLSALYAHQGRASANLYAQRARAAQDQIVTDTATYNGLENGKWRNMMDMAPRRLPVFDTPSYPVWSDAGKTGCGLAFNGQYADQRPILTFRKGQPGTQVVTLFGYAPARLDWTAGAESAGFGLSASEGALTADNGYETRITLAYDGKADGNTLSLTCGQKILHLPVRVLPQSAVPAELYGAISIPAAAEPNGDGPNGDWERIDGLGSLGTVVRTRLTLPSRTDADVMQAQPLIYPFVSSTPSPARITITALPTRPLDPTHGVRIMVSLDGGALQMLDFGTTGRSDAWRENVLSNTASQDFDIRMLTPGPHDLRVYALDPGVILDRIEVDLDGAPAHYGALKQDVRLP